jgi:hypothetical protein
VAQFFKRPGRGGITRGLQLPERITPLPREYRTADLAKFFKAAYDSEKVLFSTPEASRQGAGAFGRASHILL